MKYRLLLYIAWNLLTARLRQSIIAGIGVTFGITMFITLMGFMTGLNGLLDGLILNRTPHVRLYKELEASTQQPIEQHPDYSNHLLMQRSIKPVDRGRGLYNGRAALEALNQDPRVFGVAPKTQSQVFYHVGTTDINGLVQGIDPVEEERLFHVSDYIVKGDLEGLKRVENGIILGYGIAEKMLADLGDMVQVSSATGEKATLKIVGLYQSGLAEVDNSQSYVSLATTQKLAGHGAGYFTDLQIKLYDLNRAPELAKEFASVYRAQAVDIQTANAQFDTGSSIRNLISYAVSITLLVVAGFGIYNILNMMIYEKMDSIAILKATGFSGRDVQWIFLLLSMIIGLSGGILGLGFGYALSSLIDVLPFETEALPTIKTYPVNFDPVYYFTGVSFALATTWVAGWFPAKKASKVDPVDIIRGK